MAYNYTDDGWIYGTDDWIEVGINASHMAGPHHVLFEGNYSFNADSDYTHGNAIYMTFFRNWLSGQRRDFPDSCNNRTVGLAYGSWWDSFIGNVLGRSGQMAGWNLYGSRHELRCQRQQLHRQQRELERSGHMVAWL